MDNKEFELIIKIIKAQMAKKTAVWIKEPKGYRGFINGSVIELIRVDDGEAILIKIENERYGASTSREMRREYSEELYDMIWCLLNMVKESALNSTTAIIKDMEQGVFVGKKV